MNRMSVLIILAAAVATATSSALARGGNGGPGGQSASHMSAQGLANNNGPNAADRDKGLARAQDRMSGQGSAHEKATTHARKQHGSKKSRAKG
jgi:hypothetical protein